MSDNDDLGRDNHPLELLQYPTHRVVGVLDTEEQTRDAVDALTSGGFLATEIGIGTGPDLADQLRQTTGRSGFADLAMRFNEALGMPNDEAEAKALYERAMRDGGYVIAVLAPTAERKERALEILSSHGAQDVGYFGRLVIEKLDSRMDR